MSLRHSMKIIFEYYRAMTCILSCLIMFGNSESAHHFFCIGVLCDITKSTYSSSGSGFE